MYDSDRQRSLYEDTLEAALTEADDLVNEIDRLRARLNRLEHRKEAVENVCNALRPWIAMAEEVGEGSNGPISTFVEDHERTVALSEEEISLIAHAHASPTKP